MKEASQKLCDENWQSESKCSDTCPIAKACQFQNGDSYQEWESRVEIAAIEVNKREVICE